VAIVQRESEDTPRSLSELAADVWVGPAPPGGARAFIPAEGGFSYEGRSLGSGETVDAGGVRFGVLAGDRAAVPEEVRVLMLRGAAVVLASGVPDGIPEWVLATRADENGVFLVTVRAGGRWAAFGPGGASFGQSSGDDRIAVLVDLPLCLTADKEMAPGTDVVRDRHPQHHRDLARPGRGNGRRATYFI
jgi:predicted amidohydrolase